MTRIAFLVDAPDPRLIVRSVAEATGANLEIIFEADKRNCVAVLREEFVSYEASEQRGIELKSKFLYFGAKAGELLSDLKDGSRFVGRGMAIKQRDSLITELKAEIEHLKATRM